MNCLADVVAKKIKKIGKAASTSFMAEAITLASKIQALGYETSEYIRKENKFDDFLDLNISKSFIEKDLSYDTMNIEKSISYNIDYSSSPINKTVFDNCGIFIGIHKLRCIARSAANIIETTGNDNAKEIVVISTASALKVYRVAASIKKISGFTELSKKIRLAAGIFKMKGYSLAKKVSSSGTLSSNNLRHITGLESSLR